MAVYDYSTQDGLKRVAGGTLYADLPIGSEIEYAGSDVPTGFLAENGSTYSATTYPDLYEVLGTTTLPNKSGYIIKALQIGVPSDFVSAVSNLMSYSESSTGFNSNFGTGFCFSRRLGKLCIIAISIDSTTLAMAQDSKFCFIPEGFRPKQQVTSVRSYVKLNGNIITTSNSFYAQANGDVTQSVTGSLPSGSSIDALFVYEGA